MIRDLVIVVILTVALVGCAKVDESLAAGTDGKSAAEQRPLLISPEDLLTVRSNALASGPSITGSVQPERRADLRAEVSAVVLEVLKENGDPVKRGDLLVRLDDTSIRDSLTSAEASARAADQAYRAGRAPVPAHEDAARDRHGVGAGSGGRRDPPQHRAERPAKPPRRASVTARQQLQRTEVRAPFDGIVSDRKVSAGDTAQIGKELLKVIDPRSMRFEGMVSADSIGEVQRRPARCSFRVHGYGDAGIRRQGRARQPGGQRHDAPGRGAGRLRRRDSSSRTLAGLYAEGRVETGSTRGARRCRPAPWCATATAPSPGACSDSTLQKVPLSSASAMRAPASSC